MPCDDNGDGMENSGKNDVTRREFLAGTSLGTFALPATALPTSSPPTKRVPKYLGGGEVVQWMEVPTAWHAHVRHARTVLEKLNETALDRTGVLETGLVRDAEATFGGWNGFKIEPVVETGPTVDFPDSMSGIPVDVATRDPGAVEPDTHNCENIGDFSPYPGGVNIFDTSTQDTPCTSGYPVNPDFGSTTHMVAAAHCFGDFAGCGWSSGDDTFKETTSLGVVDTGDLDADIVVVEPDSGVTMDTDIREPDGTIRNVDGCASMNEIERRASDLLDFHAKVGCTTGGTAGGIEKAHISRSSCPTLMGEGFRSGHDAAGGDSGGPHYSIEDGDAFVLGHHVASENVKGTAQCHGSRNLKSTSFAMSCYWLENNMNYSVPT